MAYVWSKEEIAISFKGKKIKKKFIPLDIIDFPVELISDDGEFYMLWITDEEDGEWWYVVKTSRDTIDKYIEGEISVRDIFDNGEVFIAFRDYENYDEIKNLTPLKEKIREGFIKEDELPTYNAKFEADEETKKEIKSMMFKEIERNIMKTNLEITEVTYSGAPEVEISLAA